MKTLSIAIIGNIHRELMKFSIENTLAAVPNCKEVLVFSDRPINGCGTHIPIKSEFKINDYNDFCLTGLAEHVKTDHVLVIQYDGMAINKQHWTDDYFNYDYIGAPWPSTVQWIQPNERVGNGGFSLRSAKLLHTLKEQPLVRSGPPRAEAEDAVICQENRNLLEQCGINFAPIELANQFSREWSNPTTQTLGFHGVWNVPLYFDEETTYNYFATLRLTKWYNDQYHAFVENCNQKKYYSVLKLYGLA